MAFSSPNLDSHSLPFSLYSYTIVYNSIQLIGFTFIFVYIAFYLICDQFNNRNNGLETIYLAISPIFNFFQKLQFAEIVHSFFLFTNPSRNVLIFKIFGRFIVFNFCIDNLTDQHDRWFVLGLLLTWSSIEAIRYVLFVTWYTGNPKYSICHLRAIGWTILTPSSIILEIITIYHSIDLMKIHENNSIIPLLCQLYLILLIVPPLYRIFRQMFKKTRKSISNQPKNSNNFFESNITETITTKDSNSTHNVEDFNNTKNVQFGWIEIINRNKKRKTQFFNNENIIIPKE